MYTKDTAKRYHALFKMAFEKIAVKFGVVPPTVKPIVKRNTP